MIPKETADKILDAAKVEEVIGDFVTLKRQGANYLACCPFHNEKTPSFTVSPAKGFYYCFGCKKGGSSITFLMEHEGMSYADALKYLANKYHIEIIEEVESLEDLEARQRSESLYLVSDFAQKFFAAQLSEGEGRALGYNYYRSRGLEDETIRKFGLGWSPSDRYALLKAAREQGYKEEYLVQSGLCIKVEDSGKVYDRFHERAVFPIHSLSGRVIGFSARTLKTDKSVAKYVNSPETEIYDKSRTLFGMFFAKTQIAKLDKCILVEGNLDMISMHQLGITNAVASCGTSLTVQQIRQIKRFTDNVTIIYDGDAAGIHAALRGIGLVLQEGLNVKVVLLPDGKDPDDMCKQLTLEQFNAFIAENERDFITFKTDLLLEEAGGDPLKKANLINDIADTIALMPDAVKRAIYAESCAAKFDIDKSILLDRTRNTRTKVEEDQRKQWERERQEQERAKAAQATADFAAQVQEVKVDLGGAVGVRKARIPSLLAPVEKSLLEFILRNGLDTMAFTKDSPYYTDPAMTVAEFIDSSLAEDDSVFTEEPYRVTYNAYFELYDAGYSQEEILRHLVNNPDTRIAAVVADISSDKYEITEKNLLQSMTKTSTVLVNEVPKAILLYHSKKLDKRLAECKAELNNPEADAMAVLKEIASLNALRSKLNNTLGRI